MGSTIAWDWVVAWGASRLGLPGQRRAPRRVLRCQLLQLDETEAAAVEYRWGIEILAGRSVREQVVVVLAGPFSVGCTRSWTRAGPESR
jgi:hypothetical protein